jgi:hypothetical protein
LTATRQPCQAAVTSADCSDPETSRISWLGSFQVGHVPSYTSFWEREENHPYKPIDGRRSGNGLGAPTNGNYSTATKRGPDGVCASVPNARLLASRDPCKLSKLSAALASPKIAFFRLKSCPSPPLSPPPPQRHRQGAARCECFCEGSLLAGRPSHDSHDLAMIIRGPRAPPFLTPGTQSPQSSHTQIQYRTAGAPSLARTTSRRGRATSAKASATVSWERRGFRHL